MESKLLQLAISKAVAVLGDAPEREIRALPLIDSTFMLNALPDIAQLAAVRDLLAKHLRMRLSTVWIEQGDAYEVYSVLSAVWKYDPSSIRGEWLASAIRRLVQSEVTVGGPYYTGDTIAVAANIQIANFIGQIARPLPNMRRFLTDVVGAERFEDTELTSSGLLYLLASVGNCKKLQRYTEVNWYGHDWQTPLHKAVALDIMGNTLGTPGTEQALLTMCEQQGPGGLWRGEPLLKSTAKGQCSQLVTTALITEVLRNYLYGATVSSPVHLRQKRNMVTRAALQLFEPYSEPLRSSVMTVVNRVCSADKNFEITLLPYFFARALDPPSRFPNAHYTMLGLASVCTWVAYTIYDDFIDNEGVPAELPVANLAMRASLSCFRTVLPHDDRFQHYVCTVFAKMDEANAWEIDNCRFAVRKRKVIIGDLPRYGKRTVLAARTFAHALAPMAILARYLSMDSRQWCHVETAFRHYLIARQLNDDMHDWTKDIRAGQASYVVTAILRSMRIDHSIHYLDELLPAMQKHFRHTAMPKICLRIQYHTRLSRQYFAQSQLLQPSNELYVLLDNLELSVRRSLDARIKSQALADINSL